MTRDENIKNFYDISRHVELESERQEATNATALFAQGGMYKEDRANKLAPKDDNKTKRHRVKRGGKKDLSKVKCYNCDKKGHFSCDCTEPKKGTSGEFMGDGSCI
ncbi:unnamed protein product [Prunus armeniaca]|uniref:CCHC-type domain-containing protein n=1 Tax=Prunus armeniaca TaxID=36596 RepID=A0A6J5U2L3_PRUAR|nr:unnamed protein product [Prunus armeniaca]CAB4299240.1 unnamed protein product [Prunus armeniaca]